MAISAQTVLASSVAASDGAAGQVHDLLFDASRWQIRCLAVVTGGWLHGRRVLVPPAVIRRSDWLNHEITVALTRRQIEACPEVDVSGPISFEGELELARHYGCRIPEAGQEERAPADAGQLRSLKQGFGCAVEASDSPLGTVEDFIVDDTLCRAAWEIRYLVVQVGGWFRHKRVLAAPDWCVRVNWEGRTLTLHQPRRQIEESPEFDPGEPVNREAEERLYDYYGLPKSWTERE